MKTNYGKTIIGLTIIGVSCLGRTLAYSQPVTPCLVPHPGIVAWYQAESNTTDHVSANNGTFFGTPAYASGEVHTAFDFNGASYVQVPETNYLDFTNTMTVEAWVNLRTFAGVNSREVVSKFGSSGPFNCWTMAIDPATKKAYYNVNSADRTRYFQLYSTTTIPTNEWTHLAGVCDGSTMKIYVNGVLSNSTNWTYGINVASSPITIGCTMQFSPTSYFNGQIDEVSLYNQALSDCEIQSLYLVGPQGKCP